MLLCIKYDVRVACVFREEITQEEDEAHHLRNVYVVCSTGGVF